MYKISEGEKKESRGWKYKELKLQINELKKDNFLDVELKTIKGVQLKFNI